jgi:hypothetical protein
MSFLLIALLVLLPFRGGCSNRLHSGFVPRLLPLRVLTGGSYHG